MMMFKIGGIVGIMMNMIALEITITDERMKCKIKVKWWLMRNVGKSEEIDDTIDIK